MNGRIMVSQADVAMSVRFENAGRMLTAISKD